VTLEFTDGSGRSARDGETEGLGDWGTGRPGNGGVAPHPVTPSPRHPVTPSPRRPVTPSPRLPVTPSPRHPVTPSPRLPVSPSPRLPVSPSPRHPVSPSAKLASRVLTGEIEVKDYCESARNGAVGRTRTGMGYPIRPSNVRVYQFHHDGTGVTFSEPEPREPDSARRRPQVWRPRVRRPAADRERPDRRRADPGRRASAPGILPGR
jgi:hypothetical protein